MARFSYVTHIKAFLPQPSTIVIYMLASLCVWHNVLYQGSHDGCCVRKRKKTHFFVIIYRWSTWRHKRAPKSGWWQQNSSVKVKESHREKNNRNFRQHQQKRQQLEGEHQSSTATTEAKSKKVIILRSVVKTREFLTLRRAIVEKSKVIAD